MFYAIVGAVELAAGVATAKGSQMPVIGGDAFALGTALCVNLTEHDGSSAAKKSFLLQIPASKKAVQKVVLFSFSPVLSGSEVVCTCHVVTELFDDSSDDISRGGRITRPFWIVSPRRWHTRERVAGSQPL